MKRDINILTSRKFDVLVIGGGIHGAWIAYRAAIKGLKTALIEQKDFSNATSANSLKILHGGFRYLQNLDFKRMRASIKSQAEFIRIAPNLVTPLGCIVPTYGHGVRGKLLMRIGLWVNEMIGWDRNQMFESGHKFGQGKIITKEKFSKILSANNYGDFNGAALWFDALVQDTERLTITVLNIAYEHGAFITNYLKARELIIENNCVVGLNATDTATGEQLKINAHTVVNATGPWLENTLKSLPVSNNKKDPWLVRGLNIVVKKRIVKDYAIGLEGSTERFNNKSNFESKKRFYFFVPWRGCTMIGTSYQPYNGDPEKFQVNRKDIEEFIKEINLIYPPAELSLTDITFFHAGLLPAVGKKIKNLYDVQLAKRSEVIDHEKRDGIKGLISVRSVKYTTAPFVAQKVLRAMRISGKIDENRQAIYKYSDNPKWPASTFETSKNNSCKDIPPDLAIYLKSKYGKYADKVLNYIDEDNSLCLWISREPPLIAAEVLYVIREEMALRLSDIVFRRTGFGNVGWPSMSKMEALADIMAMELKWDKRRKTDEILNVLKCYNPLLLSEKIVEDTGSENFDGYTN